MLRYIAYGWTGLMPQTCRNTLVLLPVNVAPWIWGYPNRLLSRFAAVGTRIYVTGALDDTGFSSGVDDAALFARLPNGFTGGVWTNKIEVIGPLAKRRTLAGDGGTPPAR
jgi:glycerophosphoryl diester phosphodiesterase